MTRILIDKTEGGASLPLSDDLLAGLGVKPGEAVDVRMENGRAVIEPARPERVTLEWILSETRRLGPENEPETVEWGPDTPGERIDDAYSRGG